tara:strand:- start:416 stop:1456 length:1041 start_codon:yes stop_codon:yes gene_type:complete
LKIDPFYYEYNLKKNLENINVIFLHGTNIGLVDLLYKKTLELLKINTNDPFSVSKIDGNEFKDNPTVLHDNINTLSIFSERRFILLDLINISMNKSIENIILENVKTENQNYLLLIKAANLKINSFIKYLQGISNAILVPCYEEKLNTVQTKLSDLFLKHKINFKVDFIKNLTLKFSANSLTNEMELEKLDIFLTNNKNVTEEMIFSLISRNNDINFEKIIENCSNGKPKEAITIFENIYENQATSMTLIRMFLNHFKLIEKILLIFENNKNLVNVVENIKPPIFFKKKEFVFFQCKVWNLKLINIILARLIELELKCKLNHTIEKTLLSQFILSTSVLARNKINS